MRKQYLILSIFISLILLFFSCGRSSNDHPSSQDKSKISKHTYPEDYLTDIEGNQYKTVTIENQTWMAENLNVDKFRNGDPILEAKTDEEWRKARKNKQPAWCYYNNDPANGEKYGKLYNSYAVNDPRGLAPQGWKIPSYMDWRSLTSNIGGLAFVTTGAVGVSGKNMKFTDFWADYNGESGNGTNESGFSGLSGGARYNDGTFDGIGKYGYWWSSSTTNCDNAYYLLLSYSDDDSYRNYWPGGAEYGSRNIGRGNTNRGFGYSVRCLKD